MPDASHEPEDPHPNTPPPPGTQPGQQPPEPPAAPNPVDPLAGPPVLKLPDRFSGLELRGKGGFGAVYKAYDNVAKRYVAIKVPKRKFARSLEDANRYWHDVMTAGTREAQAHGQMEHKHIVRMYDVGEVSEYPYLYIVMQFIDGKSLAHHMRERRFEHRQAAELVQKVAEALAFAHAIGPGHVHRDVKTQNILLDHAGEPYLSDFGLALDEPLAATGGAGGTREYMSPEQARRWLDRNSPDPILRHSDIYSLGVVLYELLTGRRPFQDADGDELKLTASKVEPVPSPRKKDPSIKPELERICLKALAKRIEDRYASAREMAEALKKYLDTIDQPPPPPPDKPPPPLIFRRLSAYTAADADAFLQLLPGQRGAGGLPVSILFWKERLEPTDGKQERRRICVLYGQSGCGKSSLIQAGVLPRLAKHVLPIYQQATPDRTETDLRGSLQEICPNLPRELDLPQAIQHLRDRGGLPPGKTKVLIVLDQFEQWLHGRGKLKDTELVAALRQCDGARVQCLVMVRHDYFALQTLDFFAAVGVRIEQDENWQIVRLVQPDEAQDILQRLGKALGKLGQSDDPAVLQQESDFLTEAVEQLAEADEVLCVSLALFVEIMSRRDWTLASLAALGGMQGVGVKFLEDTFDSPAAPAHWRLHAVAARKVLKALVPPPDKDIRGARQTRTELVARARTVDPRYGEDAASFDDLIGVLHHDTPLITPVEAGGQQAASDSEPAKYYQLTHDHLVPSIRQWLDNHLLKTKSGQAERLLMEREAQWQVEPSRRHLPTAFEYLKIRWRCPGSQWSESERRMMRVARRRHARRLVLVTLAILLLASAWYSVVAAVRVENLLAAELAGTQARIEGLAFYRPVANWLLAAQALQQPDPRIAPCGCWLVGRLRRWCGPAANDPARQLKASLALLPVEAGHLPYLHRQILVAEPKEAVRLIDLIKKLTPACPPEEQRFLWEQLDRAVKRPVGSVEQNDRTILATASALAAWDPQNAARWEHVATIVAGKLVADPLWIDGLRGARAQLCQPLCRICVQKAGESESVPALRILAEYAKDAPIADEKRRQIAAQKPLPDYQLDPRNGFARPVVDVVDVLLESPVDQHGSALFENLFPLLVDHKQDAVALLTAELRRTVPDDWPDLRTLPSEDNPRPEPADPIVKQILESSDALAKRHARAAVALLRLGHVESVWPLLKERPPSLSANPDTTPAPPPPRWLRGDPSRRNYLIHYLAWLKVPPDVLLARLEKSNVQADELHGLILALGEMAGRLTETQRGRLKTELLTKADRGLRHPSCGVHGAAHWTLRQIGVSDPMTALDAHEFTERAAAKQQRDWYLTRPMNQEHPPHIMVIIRNPQLFLMGTPESESGRSNDESLHETNIPHGFAISALEVTRAQFDVFLTETGVDAWSFGDVSLDRQAPANGVTWYVAAVYCWWLTEQENRRLPEGQKLTQALIVEHDAGKLKVRLSENYSACTGYRLPTECEWEYACRAGTQTSFYFGDRTDLIDRYAWHVGNSQQLHLHPVGGFKPNAWGLFDMHGNVLEACLSRYPKDDPMALFGNAKSEPADKSVPVLDPDPRDMVAIPDDEPRVRRGGSFGSAWRFVRSGYRQNYDLPGFRNFDYGFRVARTCP